LFKDSKKEIRCGTSTQESAEFSVEKGREMGHKASVRRRGMRKKVKTGVRGEKRHTRRRNKGSFRVKKRKRLSPTYTRAETPGRKIF